MSIAVTLLAIALVTAVTVIALQAHEITAMNKAAAARHARPRAHATAAGMSPDGPAPSSPGAGPAPATVRETALLASPVPERFTCCEHCVTEDGTACDPPDRHLSACGDGCNAGPQVPPAAQAHADAMWQAGERYLPAPPPPVRADLPVRPVNAGQAPWTGEQPLLDREALAELDRRQYVRASMTGTEPTRTDLVRAVAVLQQPDEPQDGAA